MMERTEIVKCKCTPEEKMRFKQKAALQGLTVSDLIRRAVFADTAEEPAPLGLFGDIPETAGVASGTAETEW